MTCQRMCIACKEHFDKCTLTRLVKSSSGVVEVDLSGKKEGRGAYICSKECLERCIKHKLLNKAFKCEIDKSVYECVIDRFKD